MGRYDFVVVGAGFAGAVVAQQLHEAGRRVLVLERRHHVAGNAYDERNEHGILYGVYGPHIFNANDRRIVDYLSRFTEWRPYEHRVLAETRAGLVPVPVNRTTLNRVFDLDLETEEDAARFLSRIREPIKNPGNLEEAVRSQVGELLYRELFAGYTEKQWGRPPCELDPSTVARLSARVDDDDRYFKSDFQAMPKDGYTAMFGAILDGIDVELCTEAGDAIERSGPLANAHLVWTGPLDEAFRCCYGRLPWRSLEFEHEHVKGRTPKLPVAVINYPNGAHAETRITEWRQMTGQDADWTTLTHEYPRAEGDPYYPVPAPDARRLYKRYEALAKRQSGVTFVGRFARYQYLSMHQVVGQALRTSRELIASS